MSGIAVRVEEVSKRYRLGSSVQTYGRLSEVLSNRLRRPLLRGRRAEPEILWALSDVSFDVDAGQVIGLIGPNGAGKSTLLKILTRITSPTSGRVSIAGRVGSLLEVGTGFHPELSGRENVYLNGALLGLGRTEIDRRFEEIVEFAEVERFIDTPVKRFSSGMYVRLAFAVAAHLECDVLLVDEVLAVGDAAFQKKSLGKMGDIRSQGRTVILVSHNMSAITSICQRALLLQRGRLTEDGPAVAVARTYQSSLGAERSSYVSLEHRENRYGPRAVSRLMSVELRDATGRPVSAVPMGSGLTVVIGIRFFEPMRGPEVGFKVVSSNGASLATVVSTWENHDEPVEAGDYEYEVEIPQLGFIPGSYSLSLWVKQVPRGPSDDGIDGAVEFEILEADLEGRSPYFDLYSEPGESWLPSRWSARKTPAISADG